MKIIIVHWGSNGGGPKYAFDMARALGEKSDVELHVSFSEYSDNVEDWRTLTGLRHRVKTYRSSVEFLTGLPRWIRSCISLRNYIKHHDISVVYTPMLSIWQSILISVWLPRDAYYLSTIHDAQSHPGDSKIVSRLCQAQELRRANKVIVLTEHVKTNLVKSLPASKITVIPMGIDSHSSAVRSLPYNQIAVGFFGRILEYKGIPLFVDTILELRRRGLNIEGRVYGSGIVDESLRERGGEHIEWNNRWINPKEIDSIFDSFDIVLLPYIEASQSGVISIACGYGVPQVVTPVGGLAEQIYQTRSGLVSEQVSAVSLADSIQKIASDSELYRELSFLSSAAGQGEYSWSRAAQKLIEIVADR